VNRPPSPLNMLLSRHTRRREFITFIGGATAGLPFAAVAQKSTVPRIGALYIGLADAELFEKELREGLRELGYMEGKNIAFEFRSAEGKLDQLPELGRARDPDRCSSRLGSFYCGIADLVVVTSRWRIANRRVISLPNIMIRCPILGRKVPTGLTTETIVLESLAANLKIPLRCPACMKVHKWMPKDAWVDKNGCSNRRSKE
jgi:hypothetical protein